MSDAYIKIGDTKIPIEKNINVNINNGEDIVANYKIPKYEVTEREKPRFEPFWHNSFENFFVNDTIGAPERMIWTDYYSLDQCQDICDKLNKLDNSFIDMLLIWARRALMFEQMYREVDERNKKLEKIIIEKEINDIG